MLLTRRDVMAGCAGGLLSLAASPDGSQAAYPDRTITLVVPYPAGRTTDLLGRMVADQFKTGLGATVVDGKSGRRCSGDSHAASVVEVAINSV